MELTSTAKRAREVALERHRAEVEAANKRAHKWRALAGTSILVCVAVLVVALRGGEWRTDTPPVEQKLKVVTYGWYNKKGEFQSYDNGEKLTVQKWQP